MVAFLSSILGTYTPVTYLHEWAQWDEVTQQYIVLSENVIPSGLAGVDWLYVLSGLLFIVVIWSVFKLLGGLICKIS